MKNGKLIALAGLGVGAGALVYYFWKQTPAQQHRAIEDARLTAHTRPAIDLSIDGSLVNSIGAQILGRI